MIEPVSIPNGAGINYGEGDVRHFSEGDAMDVAGISQPTRHLAQRDVLLAHKVNEVIEVLNNKEQFVPLPVLRTTLPPNAEEIIQNFRIPPGFECRVLNAIVTSIPASISAELDIYYSANFGQSTGTQVISTSVEYTGGTTYFSDGEFIITLKNRGGATLEMVASILLTLRPLGETAGYLLPSASVVQAGPPGPAGPPGSRGATGSVGPSGSPGLVWQGPWLIGSAPYGSLDVVFYGGSSYKSKHAGNMATPGASPSDWELLAQEGDAGFNWRGNWDTNATYYKNDAVFYLDGSSYVCIAAVSSTGHAPPAYLGKDWNMIAEAGRAGLRYRRTWAQPPLDDPSSPYVPGDVVNVTNFGTVETYVVAGTNVTANIPPPSTGWDKLFTSSAAIFSGSTVPGTIHTESDYVAVASDGSYGSIPFDAYGTYVDRQNMQEFKMSDLPNSHGLCLLKYYRFARWLGSMTLALPQLSRGEASLNWLATDVVVSVANAGTVISYGTEPTQAISSGENKVPGFVMNGTVANTQINFGASGSQITLTNPANVACDVYFGLTGIKVY